MDINRVSATELKKNVSEILNSVYYGKKTTIIEKFGKPIAKIVPVEENKRDENYISKTLDEYFGSMPDFPSAEEIRKSRYFRKRNIKL